MIKTKVSLNTIEKVKTFVNITFSLEPTMELSDGRYVVDAKSILGVFSLNLCNELTLTIHSKNESILDTIEEFVV